MFRSYGCGNGKDKTQPSSGSAADRAAKRLPDFNLNYQIAFRQRALRDVVDDKRLSHDADEVAFNNGSTCRDSLFKTGDRPTVRPKESGNPHIGSRAGGEERTRSRLSLRRGPPERLRQVVDEPVGARPNGDVPRRDLVEFT